MEKIKSIYRLIFIAILFTTHAQADAPTANFTQFLAPLGSLLDVGPLSYDEVLYADHYYHQITFLDINELFEKALLAREFDWIKIPDKFDDREVFKRKSIEIDNETNTVTIHFSIPTEIGEIDAYFIGRPGLFINSDKTVDIPEIKRQIYDLLFCQSQRFGIECMRIEM